MITKNTELIKIKDVKKLKYPLSKKELKNCKFRKKKDLLKIIRFYHRMSKDLLERHTVIAFDNAMLRASSSSYDITNQESVIEKLKDKNAKLIEENKRLIGNTLCCDGKDNAPVPEGIAVNKEDICDGCILSNIAHGDYFAIQDYQSQYLVIFKYDSKYISNSSFIGCVEYTESDNSLYFNYKTFYHETVRQVILDKILCDYPYDKSSYANLSISNAICTCFINEADLNKILDIIKNNTDDEETENKEEN